MVILPRRMEKGLSKRELQVLELLLKGYMQKEIADILCISLKRVHSVKRLIKDKWQVESDIDLAIKAIHSGHLRIELPPTQTVGTLTSSHQITQFKYNYVKSETRTVKVKF